MQIVTAELIDHLNVVYNTPNAVDIANPSEGIGTDPVNIHRDRIVLSLVNLREEKSLKNTPHYVRDDAQLKVSYQNPPVYVNMVLLFFATHTNYRAALSSVSRVVRFFQHKNVFTQDNVAPSSIQSPLINVLDQLATFKLIFDLYSPTLEEINHLWGIAGSRQFPFVMYYVRMLDLKFQAINAESGMITQVTSEFIHKQSAS